MGDRVELKTTGGGSVLLGTVEKIDVMRTIVRSDKGVPVAVPNRRAALQRLTPHSHATPACLFQASMITSPHLHGRHCIDKTNDALMSLH